MEAKKDRVITINDSKVRVVWTPHGIDVEIISTHPGDSIGIN